MTKDNFDKEEKNLKDVISEQIKKVDSKDVSGIGGVIRIQDTNKQGKNNEGII